MGAMDVGYIRDIDGGGLVTFWTPQDIRASAGADVEGIYTPGNTANDSNNPFDLMITPAGSAGLVYSGTEWTATVWLGPRDTYGSVTLRFDTIRGMLLPFDLSRPRRIIFAIGKTVVRGVLTAAEATFHGPFSNTDGEPSFAEISLTIKQGFPFVYPEQGE